MVGLVLRGIPDAGANLGGKPAIFFNPSIGGVSTPCRAGRLQIDGHPQIAHHPRQVVGH